MTKKKHAHTRTHGRNKRHKQVNKQVKEQPGTLNELGGGGGTTQISSRDADPFCFRQDICITLFIFGRGVCGGRRETLSSGTNPFVMLMVERIKNEITTRTESNLFLENTQNSCQTAGTGTGRRSRRDYLPLSPSPSLSVCLPACLSCPLSLSPSLYTHNPPRPLSVSAGSLAKASNLITFFLPYGEGNEQTHANLVLAHNLGSSQHREAGFPLGSDHVGEKAVRDKKKKSKMQNENKRFCWPMISISPAKATSGSRCLNWGHPLEAEPIQRANPAM